ncbi:MAG: WD40 repeat domain-containing protein [Chloroflexota bacterium]
MIRQKQPLLRLLLSVALLSAAVAFAQGDRLPNKLEAITASNVDQLREITNLSPTFWGGFWSSDGQSYYAPIGSGLTRYDLSDPEHPVFLAQDAVQQPPPHYRQAFDLTLPVALSPNLRMGAYIVQPQDPEARQTQVRVTAMSDGSEIVRLMTDSPLVPQRYSDEMVLPQFSRTGDLLYLREGSLYRWTPATRQETLLIDHHEEGNQFNYTDIRLNQQGTYAATYNVLGIVSMANTLTFYDLREAPARVVFQRDFPAEDRWQSIAISPDRRFIAVGGNNANVRVWEIARGGDAFRDDRKPDESAENGVVDLAYSPDQRTIAGVVNAGSASYAFVREAQSGEEVARISGDPSAQPGLTAFDSVAFNPAGDRIAFGTGAGTVVIWPLDDLLKAKEVGQEDAPITLTGADQPIVDVNFSADGTKLVAASWDDSVRVWDTHSWKVTAVFGSLDKAWSAIFSPDGQTLATSSDDGTVLLWDLKSNHARQLDQFVAQNPHSRVGAAALVFSPDGSLLAGTGRQNGVYVWDVATGQRHNLAPEFVAWHLAFSPDGTFLVAASQSDSSVRLWGVPVS